MIFNQKKYGLPLEASALTFCVRPEMKTSAVVFELQDAMPNIDARPAQDCIKQLQLPPKQNSYHMDIKIVANARIQYSCVS